MGLAVQADARASWTHAVCASTDRSGYCELEYRDLDVGGEDGPAWAGSGASERAADRYDLNVDELSGRRCFLMLETGNLAQESSEKLILTLSKEAPERNPEVLLLSGARFNPAWR